MLENKKDTLKHVFINLLEITASKSMSLEKWNVPSARDLYTKIKYNLHNTCKFDKQT